jgi:hypothetical protein
VRRYLRWFFVDRRTGYVTIAQKPNLLMWIVIGSGIARWLCASSGYLGTALTFVFEAGLVLWALDEIFRGVNPWRRCLGFLVLAYQLVMILR